MPPVIEVLKQRSQQQTYPKHRNDPYKVGLLVEGGAMRGIVSAGAASVLELLGLRHSVDVVYGASAGAFNGAYFVAHQALYGSLSYLNHLNNNRFINIKRPLAGKRIVSLEYVFEEVISHHNPLDWHAVVHSDVPLRIVATDAIRAKSTIVEYGDTQKSLFEALHASAHIPGAHGSKPYHLGDKLLWDAAILDPFCIDTAIAERCTHLLVLLSLPLGREREAGLADKYFIAPYLRKYSQKLADAYIEKYSADIDTLISHLDINIKPKVLVIAPSLNAKIPGPLSKKRKLLGHGALVGAKTALEVLRINDSLSKQVLETISSYLKIAPHKTARHGHVRRLIRTRAA